MIFIRNLVLLRPRIDDRQAAISETEQLLTSFFTPKVLMDLANALITNFFLLTPEDLVDNIPNSSCVKSK